MDTKKAIAKVNSLFPLSVTEQKNINRWPLTSGFPVKECASHDLLSVLEIYEISFLEWKINKHNNVSNAVYLFIERAKFK